MCVAPGVFTAAGADERGCVRDGGRGKRCLRSRLIGFVQGFLIFWFSINIYIYIYIFLLLKRSNVQFERVLEKLFNCVSYNKIYCIILVILYLKINII